MRFITRSEAETEDLAAALAPKLCKGDVLLLRGEMGAGKTAFVRGLARGMGVCGVSSPTFALINRYEGGRVPLTHMDLYRLAGAREVEEIGFADALEEGVSAIEWPDIAGPLLPERCIGVRLTASDEDDVRAIDIEGMSDLYALEGAMRFAVPGA